MTVTVPEAQRELPTLLKSIRASGSFLIEDQGKIVARVESVTVASEVRPSLRNIKPVSVGALLRPLNADDDLLGEMLSNK